MARQGNRLIPARNISPGAVIRKEAEARSWTQEDLARIMGRPVQVISEIVSAKKQITPETALGLAAAFGTSAEMWLNLEAKYRLLLAQEKGVDEAVQRRSRIYSLVPVKEIAKRGWIEESNDVDELETRVKEFLGVASLDVEPCIKLAARRTPKKAPESRGVRAWMRRVEQLASAQDVPTFRRDRFNVAIDDVLKLTTEPRQVCEVPSLLQKLGVHLILVPHLPKTYLDGAVFAENGNPIVALTLRYDRLDSFWFTLMHELAHLISSHKGNRPEDLDADAGGDTEELEADKMAAEWLVPDEALADFVERVQPYFSRQAIGRFALSIGRHPAIVLGRLQHDEFVSPAHLRNSVPKVRRYLEPWFEVPNPVSEIWPEIGAAAVRERSAPYDTQGAVLRWLGANPGWQSPARIKEALDLERSVWNRTICALLNMEQIERTGEKRGTQYRIKPGKVPQ